MKTTIAALKKKKTIKKVPTKVRIPVGIKKISRKKKLPVELKRDSHNPIITPRAYSWESKATLNPAAFEANGKIHLVYRAIGNDDSSVLGYAGSYDGYNITDRPENFIFRRYFAKTDTSVLPLDYISGGGWNGGCEDPRLTRIDDIVYMIYTAFDGWGSVRITLTSIKLDDFEKKKWKWKNPVMISPPGEIHKNWVLFPEKINGKYVILTSISPKILISYFGSLDELDGTKFIKSYYNDNPAWGNSWDSSVRGVGPTPIKTDLGWLVLYHAMDKNDPNRYKIGAIILDLKNPANILFHSPSPILEPEEYYENNGYKWGVVYSCGAVVKDGTLFVYYGGADKVIGVASILLADLLSDLKKHKVVKLKKQAVRI